MFTITTAELDGWLAAFVYPFFRILALASSAPVLSHDSVPTLVRIGLAILVTALVAPALPAVSGVSVISWAGAALVVQQILLGVAVGLAMQIVFAAVQIAGDMIGLTMGLSFAGFVDPQHSGQSPLVGSFLVTLAMLVFLSLDGHLALLAAVTESFQSIPVDAKLAGIVRWEKLVGLGAQLFAWGLHLALPVVAAMLLVNLAMGAMTRAAPQLNLFSIGFPVTLLAGLGLLALLLPALATPMRAALEASLTILR